MKGFDISHREPNREFASERDEEGGDAFELRSRCVVNMDGTRRRIARRRVESRGETAIETPSCKRGNVCAGSLNDDRGEHTMACQ